MQAFESYGSGLAIGVEERWHSVLYAARCDMLRSILAIG
jgi:hypothetical protein